MADPRSSTVLGSTIGRHRIVRLIGGGVVGRVFACVSSDFSDDKTVAIKVLRTRHAGIGDKLMRDRLLIEKIASPHAVAVHDVAVYSNVPYIVMELVEGDSLASLLERGPLRTADALEVAHAVCLGLQAAWAHGIAHGDVRPQNILVPRGDFTKVKIGDFLLAPPVEGTESVRGSPAYLAPEILVGTPPDPLSDLYALGCTLYQCLTGKTPFAGGAAAQLHAQVNTPPPSLAAAVPGPQSLVDLVDRLLEKDRAKRIKTHGECLAAIGRVLRGMSLPAPPKPQVPELDIDVGLDDDGLDEAITDEVHTSPARDELLSALDEEPGEPTEPPAPSPLFDDVGVYRKKPAPAPVSVSDLAPLGPPPPPLVIPVAPLGPAPRLRYERNDDDEHTRIDPGIGGIPSADDLGLVLEPLPPKPKR